MATSHEGWDAEPTESAIGTATTLVDSQGYMLGGVTKEGTIVLAVDPDEFMEFITRNQELPPSVVMLIGMAFEAGKLSKGGK